LLDFRVSIVATASAVGLTLGALAWLATGRNDPLADLQTRVDALPRPDVSQTSGLSSAIGGAPLFALTTGANPVTDPAVTLMGLSRMPGRSAALLSIGGQAPAWLTVGERRDGVWLREVGAGRVTMDLPLGLKDLRLGETTAPLGAMLPSAPQQNTMSNEQPPAGYRQPPPPASAPAVGVGG